MVKLRDLAEYARIVHASSVQIVGYRAASRLSDGGKLTEKAGLAEARAKKIAGILAAVGMKARVTHVSWSDNPITGNGGDDWRNRKVEVRVIPGK